MEKDLKDNNNKENIEEYKSKMNFDKAFWIFLILLIPITICYIYQQNSYKFYDISNAQPKAIKEEIVEKGQDIPLRKMSELSSLTKKEIIEKRIEYVNNSKIFKIKDYLPKAEIYQIEDNIPWISVEELTRNGLKDNPNIAYGLSRQSISINNPELLLTLMAPAFGKRSAKQISNLDYFFPTKLEYKKENILEVHYNISDFYKKNPNYKGFEMVMDDTNARDFSYNWGYVSEKENISPITFNGIFKQPYFFQGYYHRGFSCGLESGCNNYSPYQKDMNFRIMETPAYLEFKLWKTKPKSLEIKQDMIYRMYFD